MDSHLHAADGQRERYERIAKAAAELAQFLLRLHTLATLEETDMSPLVVENITTLVIDDAAALAPRAPAASRPPRTSTPARREPGTVAPRPSDEGTSELARIDDDAADTSIDLKDAISNARQACAALARSGGRDLALLHAVAAALNQISTCFRTLGQLAHDRTRALSGLPTGRTAPSSPIRQVTSVLGAYPEWVVRAPLPGSPADRLRDDGLGRGPGLIGPGRF